MKDFVANNFGLIENYFSYFKSNSREGDQMAMKALKAKILATARKEGFDGKDTAIWYGIMREYNAILNK